MAEVTIRRLRRDGSPRLHPHLDLDGAGLFEGQGQGKRRPGLERRGEPDQHHMQPARPELDRIAGEPLDLLVNDTVVAQGEVVLVNDRYGIRLTRVVPSTDRLQSI